MIFWIKVFYAIYGIQVLANNLAVANCTLRIIVEKGVDKRHVPLAHKFVFYLLNVLSILLHILIVTSNSGYSNNN